MAMDGARRLSTLLAATSAFALGAGVAVSGPLPSGGVVTAGSASLASPTAAQLTVNQTSAKAILTWSDFSIGQGDTVRFNNGTGSTLNRVLGTSSSRIAGALSASGSVYLINPNGIVIGETGVINVGGSFVASTLDVADADYLAGGALTFSGASSASVVNLGQIGASGGDVALIAQIVENDGTITAADGDAGLLAGARVTLLDTLQNDGKFQVSLGSGSGATNKGTIQAAVVELRAYGGNVYALAGNTGGSITATGISTHDGQVFLTAQAASGSTGVGDITVSGGVAFSGGANALTLDAFYDISILTPISTTGGHVTLTTNDGGVGGDYSFGLGSTGFSGGLSFLGGAGSDEGLTINGKNYTLLYSITDVQNINNDLTKNYALAHNIDATSTSGWNAGSGFKTLGSSGTAFSGALIGVGNTINNLYINSSGRDVGLFYINSGTIRDIGLKNVSVKSPSGTDGSFASTNEGSIQAVFASGSVTSTQGAAGGLVGINNGSISDSHTSVNVTAYIDVGGLSASNYNLGAPLNTTATITDSYATGAVSGVEYVGGLVGSNSGQVSNAYATGAVTGVQDDLMRGYLTKYIGGLVGGNNHALSNVHATGSVTAVGKSGDNVGGLIGENEGDLSNVYATGAVVANGSDGGLVGSATSSKISNAYATGAVTGNSYVGGLVGVLDFYSSLNGTHASGPVSGNQIVGGLVGSSAGSIVDSDATGKVSGIATSTSSASQMGGLVGQNYGTLTADYATGAVSGGSQVGGLLGANINGGNVVQSYATGSVTGNSGIGGLIGSNGGGVEQSYATGAVSGVSFVGGLVGEYGGVSSPNGSVTNSYWNTQTSGQSTSAGGAPLTTAQMLHAVNFVGFDFSATGPWRIVEGKSFPYLSWQFSGAPGVLSGVVYSGVGGAAIGGAAVTGYEDGSALATTTSGANGYYQILVAPGQLVSADVVTFLPGAPQAATALATRVTGSATGLNLYQGGLFVETSLTHLSDLEAHYVNALGGFTSSDLVWTPGTTLSTGLDANDSLWIKGGGEFTVDQSLSLGAGGLEIDAVGQASQASSAVIQAAALTGASSGGARFTTANNQIAAFSWNNSGVGGVALADAAPVHLNTINAGSGDLSVSGPLNYRLYDDGALTAGGDITLNASHGISIGNQITAGGAVSLIGSANGGVGETGAGAISAASLSGSVSMATLQGANAVGAITSFTTTQGFLFNNTRALTVAGPINGGVGLLYLQTSAGDLTIDASLTSVGNDLLRANGDIAIDAAVSTSGHLALYANGAISETGSISADLLLGYSNRSSDLSGANHINTLLGFNTYSGGSTFTFTDLSALVVTAPLVSYAVALIDPAAVTVSGSGAVIAYSGVKTLNGAPF